MSQKTSDTETTEAMLKTLRERYPRPEWVFMTEVPNGTGSKASRRADAVAYNMYPSKGNVMICFELKASKSDLQKELKDGTKSNSVGQYADYFFLVCPDGIIDDSMLLPKTWGILIYKNGKLRQTKKPEAFEPAQMNKGFVAALLQSLARENDGIIENMNQDIRQIVFRKTQEELEFYSQDKCNRLKETISRLEDELNMISGWRDAMRKCYSDTYSHAIREFNFEQKYRSKDHSSIDEIIKDCNLVDDLAAFIQARNDLSDEIAYTVGLFGRHAEKLTECVHKMQKLFPAAEEYDYG